MIGHFTAQCGHPRYRRRIGFSLHPVSHHKEGGTSTVCLQTVQNPVGNGCVGSIVKGQCNHRPVWINTGFLRFFAGNGCTFCNDCHAHSCDFKPASLLACCALIVSNPGRPCPILLNGVADIVQIFQSSGQPHTESGSRRFSLRMPRHHSSSRPFRPAGTAHLHLVFQAAGDVLGLVE